MKRRKKRAVTFLLIGLTFLLSACGQKFDASSYTQAILDTCYKNETTKYLELTNSTKEEAEKLYNDTIEEAMSEFYDIGISDDLADRYRNSMATLLRAVKYTVGEATKTDDGGFDVPVTMEPITIYDDLINSFVEKAETYTNQLTEELTNGAEVPSEEEIQDDLLEIFCDDLETRVANITYGEPQVTTVHISKDDNGLYQMSDEDLVTLDSLSIDFSGDF